MASRIRETVGNALARRNVTAILLLGVVSLVYANTAFHGFVWDDVPLILEKKEYFSDTASVVHIAVSPDQPLNAGPTPYYRPITTLTYFLDHHVWGEIPYWYHLENLLLHGSVVLLLYALIYHAFHSHPLAVISSLVFAVHPANAEAVNFLSARNNLLCALFLLASLLSCRRSGIRRILLFSLAYLFSLLSKEPAVVMPMFLLSLATFSREEDRRPDIPILAASMFVCLFYFLLRMGILGALTSKAGIDFSVGNLAVVCSTIYENLRIMIFPVHLNAMYTLDYVSFHPYKGIIAAAGFLLIGFFSFRRDTPAPVRAGCLWIFWGLLPISNIVQIPSAPVAERYLYIPIMGYALVAGYLLHSLHLKRKTAGITSIAVLVVLLGVGTYNRNFVWKDDSSLFQSMIRSDPTNAMAHFNLGFEHMETGRNDLALLYWKEAVRIDPAFSKAHNNLGNLYALSGDYRSAITHYEKAFRLSPEIIIIQYNIARAAELMGEREKATKYYRVFLKNAEGSPLPEYRDKIRKAEARLKTLLREEHP